MKRLLLALVLAIVMTVAFGATAALAQPPRSITVNPGEGAEINVGPGDDIPPPQIEIHTPQGLVAPVL